MFDKFFFVFVVFFVLLEAVLFGENVGTNNREDAIRAGLTGLFWLAILLWLGLRAIHRSQIGDRMTKIMDEAMGDLTKFIRRDVAERNARNAEHNSQKAKTSSKRSNATEGVKKAKVSTVKKGVQNGRQRKQA